MFAATTCSSVYRAYEKNKEMPLLQKDDADLSPGIAIHELKAGKRIARIKYYRSCDEIYDVQILKNMQRPGILGTENPVHRHALTMPGTSYWSKGGEKPQDVPMGQIVDED